MNDSELMIMTMSSETKLWEGDVPKGYEVGFQYFKDGQWEPALNKLIPRNREEAIKVITEAVQRGKFLDYSAYRLVALEPVATDNLITEGNAMSKKKTAAAKKEPKPKKTKIDPSTLVFGHGRPNSIGGKFALLLKDGKARTEAEICKAIGADQVGTHFPWWRRYGKTTGMFTLDKLKDGRIQMTVTGNRKQKTEPIQPPKPAKKPPQEDQGKASKKKPKPTPTRKPKPMSVETQEPEIEEQDNPVEIEE